MYLYIDKGKYGHNTLYVAKSFRNEQGKSTSRIVERLGRYDELLKEHDDPVAWAKEYIAKLTEEEKRQQNKPVSINLSTGKQIEKNHAVLFDGGYLFLQKYFYSLGLDKICRSIRSKYDFSYNLRDILAVLVYGRILFPFSKRGTYAYSEKLLEAYDFKLQDIYRALEVISKEKDFIQTQLYKNSRKLGKRRDSILYYDCTNYYFEIEHESGMRKYGVSKENRPNPIVEMGLFMDADGIPLAFCIHDGNTSEQLTLQPLEEQIIQDFGHAKFVVCTDAGLSSTANRRFNNIADRAFITAQSIKKMKDFQKEWALSPDGWRLPNSSEIFNLDALLSNDALCQRHKDSVFFKEEWFNENGLEQRYIVSFSLKYRNYLRNIRNEQIERAKKAISLGKKPEKTRQTDFKRFVTKISVTTEGEVAEQTVYALDEGKIAEEEKFDGFYCVATNLEGKAEDISKINARRWEIEESFRIMKSEFSARPVYLSRDDRITAHFTICFLALVLFRFFEKPLKEKYTCPEILRQLKDIKFLKTAEGYLPSYTRTDLTDALHEIFGARTDFEFITRADMKKIISHSKKHFT